MNWELIEICRRDSAESITLKSGAIRFDGRMSQRLYSKCRIFDRFNQDVDVSRKSEQKQGWEICVSQCQGGLCGRTFSFAESGLFL